MNTLRNWIMISLLTIGLGSVNAQVEQEIAFQYMKAKYLLETDRHEDAVNAFNKVIKENPAYEDALVLRGESKYGLAAYRGAIKDAMEAIEINGITPGAASLLALAFDKEGKEKARDNSLASALVLDPGNDDIWMLQAEIHFDNGDDKQACACWFKASDLGNSKAARKLKSNCNNLPTKQAPVEAEEKEKKEVISIGKRLGDDEKEDEEVKKEPKPGVLTKSGSNKTKTDTQDENTADDMPDDEVISIGKRAENPDERPEIDPNEKNIIEIDEDLTLELYGEGIGSRRILDQPNILILAEEDGKVAIDICVSRTGKVSSAEFNDDLSTIKKQSLISLAIRKAKEFWFAKDRTKEMCGVIIYHIKGSE